MEAPSGGCVKLTDRKWDIYNWVFLTRVVFCKFSTSFEHAYITPPDHLVIFLRLGWASPGASSHSYGVCESFLFRREYGFRCDVSPDAIFALRNFAYSGTRNLCIGCFSSFMHLAYPLNQEKVCSATDVFRPAIRLISSGLACGLALQFPYVLSRGNCQRSTF